MMCANPHRSECAPQNPKSLATSEEAEVECKETYENVFVQIY